MTGTLTPLRCLSPFPVTFSAADRHVHDDTEVFVILQGKAVMELDGKKIPLVTGDVLVVEPGEDHHLISDTDDPCINQWFNGAASGTRTRSPKPPDPSLRRATDLI